MSKENNLQKSEELKILEKSLTILTNEELIQEIMEKGKKTGIEYKTTRLHQAASAGLLHAISPKLLTKFNLSLRLKLPNHEENNPSRLMPIMLAARYGYLKQLPTEILEDLDFLLTTRNSITGNNVLFETLKDCKNFKNLPTPILKHLSKIRALKSINYLDQTLIHILVAKSGLNLIPEEIFRENPELLTSEDFEGKNALSHAAIAGTINNFPKKLITPASLLSQNKKGSTALYQIAIYKQFEDIPYEIIKTLSSSAFLERKYVEDEEDSYQESILDALLKPESQSMSVPMHILASYLPATVEQKENLQRYFKSHPICRQKILKLKRRTKITRSQNVQVFDRS